MENASKALEIAGGVLIAVLVLGLAIFGYNNLSNYKSQEQKSEEIDQINDYNLKFEAYADDLYGSELISLTNLILDYNNNTVNQDQDYSQIEFNARMKNGKIFSNAKDLNTYYNSLIKNNNQKIRGKTITEWIKIFNIFSKKTTMTWDDNKKIEYIKDNTNIQLTATDIKDIENKIIEYKNGIQEQEEFALKLFKGEIKYDNKTGRISKMSYTEK